MRVLALESATRTGSLALVEGDKVVAERSLDASLQHSEKLMPAIMELLHNAPQPPLTLRGGVDLLAVDQGPGSFTGLRVGMALMKGIAFASGASGKPLIGVSSLEALAMNAVSPSPQPSPQEGEGMLIVPMINAHRGQVYTAVYRVGAALRDRRKSLWDGRPQLIEPEQATEPEKWLKYLAEAHRGAALQFIRDSDNPIQAKNIAFLAAKKFKEGEIPNLFELTPRYLRAGV